MAGEAVPSDDLPGGGAVVPSDDLPSVEAPKKTRPLKGRMVNFVAGNINKGIAGAADALLNAPQEMGNLVRAGIGTVATAAGRPDLAPDLKANPDLARRVAERIGWIPPDAEPETPAQSKAALGLEMLGGMLTPIPSKKPGAFTEMRDAAARAAAERSSQRATLDKTLQDSRKLGYVVPPSQVSSSAVGNAVEGLVARTTPTERVASVRNASVTNRIVKRDLGLQADQIVTDGTFDTIRKEAGGAFAAVKNSGVQIKSDDAFREALEKIKTSDYGQASKEYGEILGNEAVDNLIKGIDKKEVSPTAAVEMVKELRRRATKNLKAWDDLEKQDLGFAQRSAAVALEDLIERNLAAAGKGKLVSAWKEARQTIAKTHDAEAAWDGSNFSAKELAKLKSRGAPLSGGMNQAAEFARHFPKASQDVTNMAQKSGFSQYDMWGGVAGAMATGHPEALAIAAVPWATQRALLHPWAQRLLASPDYKVGLGLRGMAEIDPMLQKALMQGGVLEGQDQ